MKKLLVTLAAFTISVVCTFAAHDPSCNTQFSGTTFKPKAGVSSSVYSLEDIVYTDASSEKLSVFATFNPNPSSLKVGEYYIDSKGLHICVGLSDRVDLLKYDLTNLTTKGGDYYRVEYNFTTEKTPGTSGSNKQVGFHSLFLDDGSVKDDNPYWQLSASGTPQKGAYSVPYTIDFKVKNSQTSGYTILQTANMQSDNKSMVLLIKSIKVTGCYEERIIIENGTNCCKGEENAFTLKTTQTYSSYKWEYSSDNKATWKTIPGNTKSVKTTINDDKIYIRVTYGGKKLEAGPISSVICCSADGTKQDIIKEDFTFKDPGSKGAGSNSGRLEFFDNYFEGKVTTSYKHPDGSRGSYSINADQCAVVDRANAGGWWSQQPVLSAHTGNGADDGFLLVNCAIKKGDIFKYTSSNTLCTNTLYNFSAWVANAVADANQDKAPVNVSLIVNGLPAGTNLLTLSTGDLPSGTPWTEMVASFNSGNFTQIELILRNNLDPEDKYITKDEKTGQPVDVNGNDVGLDDVLFTSCAPSINIFSGDYYKSKDTILCNKNQPADLKLQPNASYDIRQFFSNPLYLYQVSADKKTWTDVGTISSSESTKITVSPTTHKNGMYYRVWVGGSEQAIRDAIAGKKVSACGMLTAVSEAIKVSYYCDNPCKDSPKPTVKDYNECPLAAGGTIDLGTLVTANKDTLKWYDSQTATKPMTNTKVDVSKPNPTGTSYYVSNTKTKISDTDFYCESERVKVTVKVKDAIKFSVSPLDITTCVYEGADLSYKVSGKTPATAVIEWQDGSATSPTGDTYTIDKKTRGQGTIKLVATDPAKTSCESTQSVTYNLTDVNKFTLKAEPAFVCTGNPVSTITATIESGEGDYTLYKKVGSGAETKVKSGVVTSADKTVTYEDKSVATVATTVTYRMVFGEGKCQYEQETTVEVGSEFEIPVESSAVSPKDKVCVGSPITLSTTYTPITGEILIWEENGAEIGRGTSVSIAAVNAKTTYTVKNQNGTCDGNGSITIDVDKPIKAVIKSSTPAVCENNPVDLMDTNTEKASEYQWQKSEDGGATWQDMAGETGREIKNYIPEKTASYRLVTKNGECLCEAVSDPVTVTVTPPPSIESITEHTICISNPSVKITAKINSDAVPYEWFKGGASFASGTTTAGQTEIILEDNAVAGSAVTVTYKLVLGITGCSDEKETTVKVTDRVTISITSNVTDDRICAGDLFNLTASYQLVGSEWLKWEKAGEELTEKGTKLTGETINESSVLYKVTLMDGQCDGDGEITMYADIPANPVIDASDKNICKGSVINLIDDDVSAATEYIWESNTGSDYKPMEGKKSKDIMGYAPEETATYRLTVKNGVCTRTSNEVTVKVNPPIEFKVSADQSICSGDGAVLVMSGYPATATVGWYNGSEQISESDKVTVSPSETTVYTAKVIDVCTASKNSTVNVEPAIEYTISPDGDICVGESRQLEVTGGKSYSWIPASSLDDATSATPKATPRETTTYEVTISTDLCSTKANTTVRVHPLPIIKSIENGEQGEVLVTVTSGTEPYYYSTNGKDYVDSNVFTGLTIGAHIMYVKDSATCETQQLFEVPPVPVIPDVFFSPNDDGLYDLWTVKNLSYYSEYKVEIFDRYGKRLVVFNKGGYSGEHNAKDFIGWDGIYNGHEMPSDDYWYIITVEEIRKQIKGHFILKR